MIARSSPDRCSPASAATHRRSSCIVCTAKARSDSKIVRTPDTSVRRRLIPLADSVPQKIRTLFWISTSNFVFPVILGVAQLSIYMMSVDNYLLALYVEEVNFSFTIMGVVFATVWAAESRWADGHNALIKPSSDTTFARGVSVAERQLPLGAQEMALVFNSPHQTFAAQIEKDSPHSTSNLMWREESVDETIEDEKSGWWSC